MSLEDEMNFVLDGGDESPHSERSTHAKTAAHCQKAQAYSRPKIFRPSAEIICGAQTGSQTM